MGKPLLYYKGFHIFERPAGGLLLLEEGSCDYEQEPLYTLDEARAYIDEVLDGTRERGMGS